MSIAPPPRRLSINLPEPAFEELRTLAAESGRTMTELIRMALGLVKVAIDETKDGKHKLFVGTNDGKPVKELVLPR